MKKKIINNLWGNSQNLIKTKEQLKKQESQKQENIMREIQKIWREGSEEEQRMDGQSNLKKRGMVQDLEESVE